MNRGSAVERAGSISVEVLHFALVTHAVEAERVRARLPSLYELETFEAADGVERALVSTTCFCNHDFRPYALAYPRLTFNESTYRTYVRLGEKRGVYFFGRYLEGARAAGPQRLFARDTFLSDFEVEIDSNENGYELYSCGVSSKCGDTHFVVRALDSPRAQEPFESGDELAQFITYRLHGFFTSSLGCQGHMPVGHKRMRPFAGELESGRFDLWERLGILAPEEVSSPHSVLVQPPILFTLYPPRLARA
ncbi:MAG: DUF2071 domain-containing protein [Actinomycetota bacterium]|nr:DUF2071 domain-containing protein [Actinomycetota bacterium]